MATFTDTALVSGVPPANVETTPSNLSLSPDIRFLSTSETQQTTTIEDAGPTAALTDPLKYYIG